MGKQKEYSYDYPRCVECGKSWVETDDPYFGKPVGGECSDGQSRCLRCAVGFERQRAERAMATLHALFGKTRGAR